MPSLSVAARNILVFGSRECADPVQAFQGIYGDYYVAGLNIGAGNASMVITQSSATASSKDIAMDVTGTFMGFSKSKHLEDHEAAANFEGAILFSAFDTLQGIDLQDGGSGTGAYFRLKELADANIARGEDLQERVRAVLERLKICDKGRVSQADCGVLNGAGLVVELVFLPYAALREYVSIVSGRH